MPDEIEQIKCELLERYEAGSVVDIFDWVSRYPQCREELLDFWVWLAGTPLLSEIETETRPEERDQIAVDAVRQACLAISFGPQWLDKSFDFDPAEDDELGSALSQIRGKPYRFQGRASKAFRKAVVYAWIVQRLAPRRKQVTRLAAQKVSFVLERALCLGLFTDHQQKPLGPYDHKAKYRDAEPIATRSGWMLVQGSDLEPGEFAEKLCQYLPRYVRSESLALRLIERLERLADEELEVWATVIWAADAITVAGEKITVEALQSFLARSPEWSPKLRRASFCADALSSTLERLARLRLIGQ
jgi:hypothetical protein